MNIIEREYNRVYGALFNGAPELSYNELIDAIASLADTVTREPTNEDTWYIGEFNEATLDAVIVGAYWHLYEWHGGTSSASYAALCAVGNVFNPGMSCGPELETGEATVYELLNERAMDNG